MTPYDFEMTTECEFIGGPVDGLRLRIYNTEVICAFREYLRKVVTVKSCGVTEEQSPIYNRTSENRFKFIGYR